MITDLLATYGTSIKVFWDNVQLPMQNGVIIGYQIKYQQTSLLNVSGEEFNVINVTSIPPPNSYELTKLALKSNNTFKIAAITSKGVGVFSNKYYGESGDYSKLIRFLCTTFMPNSVIHRCFYKKWLRDFVIIRLYCLKNQLESC